jgi:hypothetical protein
MNLYHIVPPRVEGPELMSLHELRGPYPALFEEYSKKYQGREELMAQMIPILNKSWNDVIQLSPVHPEEIRDAMLKIGFGWRPMLFFEIDPVAVGMNSQNTVVFKHLPKQRGDFSMRPEDFESFDSKNISSYSTLPEITKNHFAESKANNTAPMLFIWVPHVLYAGRISVAPLKIIEV